MKIVSILKNSWNWLGGEKNSNSLTVILGILTVLAAFYIGIKQNSINNELLNLNYEPGLVLDYSKPEYSGPDGLIYKNNGKSTILFYQRSFINDPKEKIVVDNNDPTPILPGQTIQTRGSDIVVYAASSMGTSTDRTFPIIIFFKTADLKKFILTSNLHLIRDKNRGFFVSLEGGSYARYDWPEK